MRIRSAAATIAASAAATLLVVAPSAAAASQTVTAAGTTYAIGSAGLDSIANGPWTTSQPDVPAGQSQQPTADLFPYTPTVSYGSQLSNLAAYTGSGTAVSGQAGTPGPVDGYCASGGAAPESGAPVAEPKNIGEPFAPYYFPYIVRNADGTLTGYFDYRPKDTDEALVSATSSDGGKTWTANGQALDQNGSYCPDGDTNDNGQGHTFVTSVGGTTYLYTLNRVAGDQPGVGMLVHTLTGGESAPLAGLPAQQSVGADPDTFSTGAVAVPAASGTAVAIPVSSLGTAGTATALGAGTYIDTTVTPNSSPAGAGGTAPDLITCTGSGTSSLTGCTAATGESVGSGDTLEALVSTVTAAASIPAGPNNASATAGATVGIAVPSNPAVATAEEANLGAGRVYIDGNAVNCVGDSVSGTTITLTGCTAAAAFSPAAGDPVTFDPIQPSGARMTTGLLAPDGIVGTVPSYPGAPSGSTTFIYGEKLLNYYAPTTTSATVALPASGSTASIPLASAGFFTSSLYPQFATFGTSGGSALTFSFGDTGANAVNGFASVSCTGYTASPAALTGCSSVTGAGDSISSGSSLAIPGAALVPASVLAQTGEGNTKSKSLYKNNEDYTVLQAAYTTDGVTFSSAGLPNGGLISGTDPANDINNPAATASPSTTSPYDNPVGSPEPTELRFVGSRGTIFTAANGNLVMLMSGAWATDGDSDAFNQIFVTTSSDGGEQWSTPTTVVSTDYTFSARAAQDAAQASGTDQPLNVSAYYAGRAYSPSAVVNPDGSVTLVFSGYSSPKPIPAVGAKLGTNSSAQWTVAASDPALYRDILTVTLTPQPAAATPEVGPAAVLPVLAGGLIGVGALVRNRRRRPAAQG